MELETWARSAQVGAGRTSLVQVGGCPIRCRCSISRIDPSLGLSIAQWLYINKYIYIYILLYYILHIDVYLFVYLIRVEHRRSKTFQCGWKLPVWVDNPLTYIDVQ